MPLTQITPYAMQLRVAVAEARALADQRGSRLLLDMLALVVEGRYGEVRGSFDALHPAFRERLGSPPCSREQDRALHPEAFAVSFRAPLACARNR